MHDQLTFGVFPLGLAGAPTGVASGPPDDYQRIGEAIERLGGFGEPLLVRMYVTWAGRESTPAALEQVAQLADADQPWDLVLCYRDPAGDVDGWAGFVASVVGDHGRRLDSVQVTAEANLAGIPAAADGAFPRAVDALVAGVRAGAAAKRGAGAGPAIGFAVAPVADPRAGPFWPALADLAGPDFAACLDYVGLDMYPDVFGPPVAVEQLAGTVELLLRGLREQALPIAGIGPSVPIRVCESGWPTGPSRSEQRQADVLETIVRGVSARRRELHVTHWELFTLRDADSGRDDIFHRFGVLHDDYSPKPAFERLRRVLAELRAAG